MFARSTTFQARLDAVDDGVTFIREEVYPALQPLDGYIGLSCLVNRGSGRCISTTAWESEAAMRASDAQVLPLRERAADRFGARPEIRHWEIAVLHRMNRIPDGACARVTWTKADVALVEDNIAAFRDTVPPQLEDIPGFCSTSLLVDRTTGRSALATTYESADALEDSRHAATSLRTDATRRMSMDILEVAEFEVAMAHLRVPETV